MASISNPSSFSVAHDQWLRYVYLRDNGHLDYVKKADACEDFFAGLQWREEDLQKLRAVRRPALTINKVLSTLTSIFGEQIFNRTDVVFRAAPDANPDTADTLAKVWRQIADANQYQWLRTDMFCDGAIGSRGFLDVRLRFDDNLRGEVAMRREQPRNVLIDSDADEYDPDTWGDVILSKWYSPLEIEHLYGKETAKELKNRSGSAFQMGFDSIDHRRRRFGRPVDGVPLDGRNRDDVERYIRLVDRQFYDLANITVFVDPVTGDTRPVPENWERNRIVAVREKYGLELMDRIERVIGWRTTADDIVLHDERSPYKHFTLIPFFPFFRSGRTIGLAENLLGPQELLNKSLSQELHVVNTTANSGWKLKTGSLQNMSVEEMEARGATTGLVLELLDIGDAEKIQANAIPQGLDRLSFKAEEHMKGISNVSDSMQGFDREDVAAKAIAAKTRRSNVNFAPVTDNMERTDFFMARAVLDLVQVYYSEPRVMRITHDDLNRQTEDININQLNPDTGEVVNDLTLGEYSIVVISNPHRATMEETQFDHARELKELGVNIPDSVLIENSRLQRKREVLDMINKESSSPEAKQMQELQIRKMTAEIEQAEADALLKKAQAHKAMQEAEAAPADPGFNVEKYRIDQKTELDRELGHRTLDIQEGQADRENLQKRAERLRMNS